MRDLASIVTIETKNKMFEKDRICVVTFKENGYEAIVPVENNVGDKMVFIQEGSILPETERWEFLRKRCYREDLKGFLIKPMTMGAKDFNGEKGDRVKSWGLCVTLEEAGLLEDLNAGADVTDKLGIRKYEDEEDASPKKEKLPRFIKFCLKHKLLRWIGNIYLRKHQATQGSFPTDIIQKSDETTIQNYKSVFNLPSYWQGTTFITAKLEGQSFTVSLDKHTKKLYVCSRNNRYNKDCDAAKTFFEAARRYDIENKLKQYYKETGDILVIQGEQCGPGIQGNIYNFEETKWFVFRVKAIKKSGKVVEYCYHNFISIVHDLGLAAVPLVDVIYGDVREKFPDVNSWVKYAETVTWNPAIADNFLIYHPYFKEDGGKDELWKTCMQHEGIVVKSSNYNKEEGTGFSFKVKNLAYAEKSYTEMAALARKIKEEN